MSQALDSTPSTPASPQTAAGSATPGASSAALDALLACRALSAACEAPLIDFAALDPAAIAPAVDLLLADAEAALAQATADAGPRRWAEMAAVLDVPLERLERVWGAIGHVQAVADTPELRAAYNAALPKISAFYTRLGADARLYQRYQTIAAEDTALSPAAQRALRLSLQGFELAGATLQGDAAERFRALREASAQLGQRFSEHVLDATNAWHWDLPLERLAGLPAEALAAAERRAQEAGAPAGHGRLTLHEPVVLAVMRHCRDRAVREGVHRASVTRASDLGPAELDNTALMREILENRQQQAELLGYPHHAAVSLARKMAPSPEAVLQFMRDLAVRARPGAERELKELTAFAAEHHGLDHLQPWDLPFVGERLREARYSYSESEVQRYFPLPRVLEGLFGLLQRMLGVVLQPVEGPKWHPDVQWFGLFRSGPQGTPVGDEFARVSLDLAARPGKRPGAWMDGARSRWLRPTLAGEPGQLQRPVAHLVCNFAPAEGGKPMLLTHDNLVTLFHEFGHGLHHLLTEVDELGVAGISGVEWDAVELPSQFMENFCWERGVITTLSAHVDTGEPLPQALFDRMHSARNFLSALAMLRQCEFALFDMQLHLEPGRHAADIGALASTVRAEVAVAPVAPFNRFAWAFSHIFAGGYSAGYYSYKWAEVLSADAYAAFEEAPAEALPAVGERWKREILAVGGSRGAMDSFQAFRGRAPELDALLRHAGLAARAEPAAESATAEA